ncbi:hypothetical protein [Rhizobium viscosum]|uniref:DUF4234 domain-containing protein n=1 Tax=Rhizobium viscosum TaxID=1673 RepID=A0ABR9ILQ6_RHIVS|nr:hypothetical protein [Rhizobium viscosum]MBE1504122.1 hypothetical protein [Rhizobium viscosum]
MKLSIFRNPAILITIISTVFSIFFVIFGGMIFTWTADYFAIDLSFNDTGRQAIQFLLTFIIIMASITTYYFLYIKTENESHLDYLEGSDVEETYIQVANNLNVRIRILEARSLLIYWSMIFVIVSGVVLILFSGYLSSLDSYGSSLWALIEQGNPTRDASMSTTPFSTREQPVITLTEEQKNARFKSYIDGRDKLTAAMINVIEKRTDDGKSFNVSSTILRVSILGMLIFLVQILMQLYRYNSRLITFYSSRRDAIVLGQGHEKSMRTFSHLLLPTGFDFGREPHHPFEEAAQLIRDGAVNTKDRIKRQIKKKPAVPKVPETE